MPNILVPVSILRAPRVRAWESVVFSCGPLPNLISDDKFSCMSSFSRWLLRWCPNNNVGYLDNWKTWAD